MGEVLKKRGPSDGGADCPIVAGEWKCGSNDTQYLTGEMGKRRTVLPGRGIFPKNTDFGETGLSKTGTQTAKYGRHGV